MQRLWWNKMINCLDISKKFDDKSVLNKINFEVMPNQIYGIVGPNGSGKTTLCRVLAGVIRPETGSFRINGFDGIKDIEKIRKQMGYMPQIFSLYSDLTVMENLKFFARVYGVNKQDFKKRSENLLSFTRLAKFKNRQAGKLSGGMYKKLALACSLIYEPKLLLLDEPTIGVDPVSRRELWDILVELISRNITVVFTTSYMDEAERCNNICMLNQGEIVVEGKPEKLKSAIPLKGWKLVTDKGRALYSQLSDLKGVFNTDIMGSEITVYYPENTEIKDELIQFVQMNDAKLLSLDEIKPNFEEVFLYYKNHYEKYYSNQPL